MHQCIVISLDFLIIMPMVIYSLPMQFLGYVERTHDFLVCTHVIINAYCEMIGVKCHILYMSWVLCWLCHWLEIFPAYLCFQKGFSCGYIPKLVFCLEGSNSIQNAFCSPCCFRVRLTTMFAWKQEYVYVFYVNHFK